MQHQREQDNMPRHGSCQSGPDDSDASQSVDYEEGEALKEIDAEDGDISDLERHARRHGWKDVTVSLPYFYIIHNHSDCAVAIPFVIVTIPA